MEIQPKRDMDLLRTDLPLGPALVERAKVFAYAAHAATGQVRKYTGSPYIIHPKAVVAILEQLRNHTDVMLAAAWLHDVVEDTQVSLELLMGMFGQEVTRAVWFLSDPKDPEKNRATRMAETRDRLASAPEFVQTIKIADMIDNSESISVSDPDFWIVYRREKIELLKVLRAGDIGLWNRAAQQCGMEERR